MNLTPFAEIALVTKALHLLGELVDGGERWRDTDFRRDTFVDIARDKPLSAVQSAVDGALVFQRRVGNYPREISLVADANLRSCLRQGGVFVQFDIPEDFRTDLELVAYLDPEIDACMREAALQRMLRLPHVARMVELSGAADLDGKILEAAAALKSYPSDYVTFDHLIEEVVHDIAPRFPRCDLGGAVQRLRHLIDAG